MESSDLGLGRALDKFWWLRCGDTSIKSKISKEYRTHIPYEPEIFIDIFEEITIDGNPAYCKVIWEIKPVLNKLGETLRQCRRYQEILKSDLVVVVYNVSRISHEKIVDFFESEGFLIYQVSALECERLEVLK